MCRSKLDAEVDFQRLFVPVLKRSQEKPKRALEVQESLISKLNLILFPLFENQLGVKEAIGLQWKSRGASWGLLGVSWEPLGGLLGASWGLLGPSWGALGALLGAFGALLGPSWRRSIKEGGVPN